MKLQINAPQKSTNCLTQPEVLKGGMMIFLGSCNVGLIRRDISGFMVLRFAKVAWLQCCC